MSKCQRVLAIVLLVAVPVALGPVATLTSTFYTARDITTLQGYCGIATQYTLFGFPLPWIMKSAIVSYNTQCNLSGICTKDCPTYFWEAFWIDMSWYVAAGAAVMVAVMALGGRMGIRHLRVLKEMKIDRRKTRLFVTTGFLLSLLGMFFLAPIVGVDGVLNFADHCQARTSRWIDWHSLGYQLLGVGYSYRMWIELTLCE